MATRKLVRVYWAVRLESGAGSFEWACMWGDLPGLSGKRSRSKFESREEARLVSKRIHDSKVVKVSVYRAEPGWWR